MLTREHIMPARVNIIMDRVGITVGHMGDLRPPVIDSEGLCQLRQSGQVLLRAVAILLRVVIAAEVAGNFILTLA